MVGPDFQASIPSTLLPLPSKRGNYYYYIYYYYYYYHPTLVSIFFLFFLKVFKSLFTLFNRELWTAALESLQTRRPFSFHLLELC